MATPFPAPVTAAQVPTLALWVLLFFFPFLRVSNGGGGEWVQVGTYFVGHYYQVLQQQPDFVHQFYSDASTMLRIDGNTGETAASMLVDPSLLSLILVILFFNIVLRFGFLFFLLLFRIKAVGIGIDLMGSKRK